MKFNKLNKGDKDFIKETHQDTGTWDMRMDKIKDRFDISERTVRRWINQLGLKTKDEQLSEEYKIASNRETDKSKKYFLVTWAQNATPVHQKAWNNMKAYAKHLDASIHVIAGRYKNPTSLWTEGQESDEWWSEELVPFLDASRHKISPLLTILSDVKIHPTATYPLSGLEGMSKGGTIIVGSPKIHLQPLPVLKDDPVKFMMTTGAITKPNYTDSKAGKKGEFFHMLGFTVVELDGDEFYFRQVHICDDGSFTDLNNEVKSGKIKNTNIDTAVLGDVHHSEIDPLIENSTIKMLDILKPKQIVLHDLFSGKSVSHHDRRDPALMYEKFKNNEHLLSVELDNLLDWVDKMLKYNPVVVASNHNEWVDRYIRDMDWRKDIPNAEKFAELLSLTLSGKADDGVISAILKGKFKNKITYLARNEGYRIKDYELSQHGDHGQNGSRGSLKQFARLNTKIIKAHDHAAGRIDGAVSVGTMTQRWLGYSKGASSANNAHAIIHRNGAIQHIIFKSNGKFTNLV